MGWTQLGRFFLTCQLGLLMCLQSVWWLNRLAERCWSQLALHVLELLLIASGPSVSSRLVRLHQHGSWSRIGKKKASPNMQKFYRFLFASNLFQSHWPKQVRQLCQKPLWKGLHKGTIYRVA